MATAGIQLQKLTECSICLKEFTDPRMLPCIHTFCLECLQQTYNATVHTMTARGKQQCRATVNWGKGVFGLPKGNMPCPVCRQIFTIPADGLEGLQKNFFMEHLLEVTTNLQLSNMSAIACDICKHVYEDGEKNKSATMCCLECRDNLCETCAKGHQVQKLSKDHHVVKIGSETEEDMRRISPNRNCNVHSQKLLDYYCPICKKIVCVSCVLENHASHKCKDVSTVEKEFRQAIEKTALQISICADEMLSKERSVEQRKKDMLIKLAQTENEIRKRNLELKKLIDDHTESLLDKLSQVKRKQIKDFETENEEIERSHTILKSFETYCTEVRSKGSASDICSCADELITRANELQKDHEAFIGRPFCKIEIFFQATDLQQLLITSNNNVVGRIQENSSLIENCVLIAGLYDGQKLMQDVFKINLHRPNEISIARQIPTTMQNGATAAVHCNSLYFTGIGVSFNEIWRCDFFGGWMKCASMIQGRNSHCSAFVEDVLYICGGYVAADKKVLDNVEGYNAVTNICSTVGKLVHCVQSSGNCVPYKSSLYIFGGTDQINYELSHVQMYNADQNVCTLLSKPLPRPCSMMQAALWETSAILVGCSTCFIFNFETETWQEREQFKTDVLHFGLALVNDRIFVIGGGISKTDEADNDTWICRDDVRYVSLQSIIENRPVEWNKFAILPKPVLIQTYGKTTISSRPRRK